ncbi:MAG: hypothetical protein ACLQT6_02515 [Desulfomonilaceae bacterium]
MSVEASLGKWGPGVEADGLVVEISPLDEQGQLVPAQGTVEVELIGQGASQTAGGEFATLGRWVQSVWLEDFGYRGARCRLPFQAVQPEFDLRWAPKGIVHVRLARFDIYEGIAWCFYNKSYRNHEFLTSCPGQIKQIN